MRCFLLFLWCCSGLVLHAQTALEWSDLSENISWESADSEAAFPTFQKATFSPDMKALEGKSVTITGFLLILDGAQSVYLLSKNPMASCFFCGNGGPETVLDLQFAEPPSFPMDALLSVEGTLRLNGDDPNNCYYQIENANAFSLR